MRTLCVGEALVDLVCEHPVVTLTDAGAFVPRLGGSVAALAVAAARRGADVALAGAAGDDPWGGWVRDRLQAEGVDLTWFASAGGGVTPVALVTVAADGHPSAVRYGADPGTLDEALAGRLGEAVDACGALVISAETLVDAPARARTMAAREQALAAGKPVVLHLGLQPGRWRSTSAASEVAGACVPGAFLVSCTAAEAVALTGEREVAAAAASLRAAGAQHVVVLLGDGGALLRGGVDRDVGGVPAATVDEAGVAPALTGVLLAALARTSFYPAALAAMLPDAVQAAARAAEHHGAVPAPAAGDGGAA